MPACLSFEDIVAEGKPRLSVLDEVGREFESSPLGDEKACVAFSHEVRALESTLTHTYVLAASISKRSTTTEEVAEIWQNMERFCAQSLDLLRKWKEKYPHCGTAELFDLALDYKLACSNRYRAALEEIECQKIPTPPGLFPEPI